MNNGIFKALVIVITCGSAHRKILHSRSAIGREGGLISNSAQSFSFFFFNFLVFSPYFSMNLFCNFYGSEIKYNKIGPKKNRQGDDSKWEAEYDHNDSA